MKKLSILLSLMMLSSCSKFVEMTDESYSQSFKVEPGKSTKIFFSHNINGETHPCGCRNFPLGGIPQVNGIIKKAAENSNIIYIDSGDTFFESPTIPEFILKSSTFSAHKIAEAMDRLGLTFYTPGEHDFALGPKFLIEISKKHKFDFLMSNASESFAIKHKKHAYLKINSDHLFFIGVTNPSLLKPEFQSLFIDPKKAIETQLVQINQKYKEIKNKQIYLISHSGMKFDKELVKNFPQINWVIGAHSQSYLKKPDAVGKTKLVQVLSRNHHLGLIDLGKSKDQYSLIEVREEKERLIKPNPMTAWLSKYKDELNGIQKAEQGEGSFAQSSQRVPTSTTCLECHSEQVDFWQGTAHSLAFITLQKANAENNTQCIGCHSLEFRSEKGFTHADKIVQSEKEKFDIKSYWKEVGIKTNVKKSIREMKAKERKVAAKAWHSVDTEQQVLHQNANVQCLHCHTKNFDHPFDDDESARKTTYMDKCITCHTPDQSPEWYEKNAPMSGKDLATFVNKKYFSKKLKAVSCPKIERN